MADSLVGGSGADRLHTGAGQQDSVDLTGDGDVVFADGPGENEISYEGRGIHAGVTVDLQAGTGQLKGLETVDRLYGRFDVRATRFADVLRGDGGPNLLNGKRGNDLMEGRAGADTLLGDAGDDHIDGGEGWDYLDGFGGIDRCLNGEEYGDGCDLLDAGLSG